MKKTAFKKKMSQLKAVDDLMEKQKLVAYDVLTLAIRICNSLFGKKESFNKDLSYARLALQNARKQTECSWLSDYKK